MHGIPGYFLVLNSVWSRQINRKSVYCNPNFGSIFEDLGSTSLWACIEFIQDARYVYIYIYINLVYVYIYKYINLYIHIYELIYDGLEQGWGGGVSGGGFN